MIDVADDAPTLPITFRPRATPLAPVAAVARGHAARALAERLLAREDAGLGELAGVSAPGMLLLLGKGDALPWVDGIVYLGHDPAAPSLLLPTTLEPDVPSPLLERAVLARGVAAPVAVLVDPPQIVSAATARPVERARLAAFLRAAGEASA